MHFIMMAGVQKEVCFSHTNFLNEWMNVYVHVNTVHNKNGLSGIWYLWKRPLDFLC